MYSIYETRKAADFYSIYIEKTVPYPVWKEEVILYIFKYTV